MSFVPRLINSILRKNKVQNNFKSFVKFYSRRNNSKNDNIFIIVNTNKNTNDLNKPILETVLNWELLAPYGYRFYLPGNVGLAWHDSLSHTSIDEADLTNTNNPNQKVGTLSCMVYECPFLLRQGIIDIFPGANLHTSNITIINLIPELANIEKEEDPDITSVKMAKCFIIAAKDVCTKLQIAGYWADFINPFSGRPYMSGIYNPQVQPSNLSGENPQKAIISVKGGCVMILSNPENKLKPLFEGRLFTNAPSNLIKISEILNGID